MDLSIFDAFDKPSANSNINNKRISTDRAATQSAHPQEKKKKHSDELELSTDIKDSALELTEVTVRVNDTTTASKSYIPAKEYKFKLDPFQQTAVDHIERGDSVLVAAHTSAGAHDNLRVINIRLAAFQDDNKRLKYPIVVLLY